MKHYVVMYYGVIDSEDTVATVAVKHTFEEAKQVYETCLAGLKNDAKDLDYDVIEEDEDSFIAYLEGCYSTDHLSLAIVPVEDTEVKHV